MRKSFLSFLIFIFLISLFGLRANAQSQSITGYYTDNNNIESIANIPWADYTQVIMWQTQAGVNGSGVGNGTVDSTQFIPADIPAFVTAAHAAGKKALWGIRDNTFHLSAFSQNTASGMLPTFATNITNFTTSNGFDGVVLDWEQSLVASQYEALIAALRTDMPTKIIHMTGINDVCCGSNLVNTAVAKSSILDQVEIMCYDLDQGEGRTEYNDPLTQGGNLGLRACDWDVAAFTNAGVPKAKITVGMPFYGRRWPGSTHVLETTSVTPSTFHYRDLVTDATRWQPQYRFYDSTYGSDYLSIPSPAEFDSFTGPNTIAAIVAWGKAQGFGGFMTYELFLEYLSSASGTARYPLSTALYNAVVGGVSPPTGLSVVIQ